MDYKEYLEAHGLRQDYVEKEWGWHFEQDGIVMPSLDKDGKLHHRNKRMLSGNSKFIADPGSHPNLYGVHKIEKLTHLVYCEGQPDAVRLWQENIPAVTSTGGVRKLDEALASSLKDKVVYICLDSDQAGQSMIFKAYEVISKFAKETKIIDMPKEFKDVCEFFAKGLEKSDFKILIEQAVSSVDEWLIKNAPTEHRVESVSELLTTELPPEQWIIDKLVPMSGFSVIAGEEATGKTFYAISMAKSAVTGEPWLGQYNVEKTCKVLILDKENERVIMQDRFRGLGMEVCGDNIFRIVKPELFSFINQDPEDKDGGVYSRFARMLSAFVRKNDIQLIILDSLVDFIVGDENSGADTQAFFNAVRELFPGRSIMFLAHYGKPIKGQLRSPAQMIAGSRNIAAQITSGLAVQRSEYASNEFVLQSIKARNSVNDKSKFKVVLHSKKDPGNPNKTIVFDIEYTGIVEDEVMDFTRAMEVIQEAVNAKGELGLTRQEAIDVASEAGVAQRTADKAIKQISVSPGYEYRKSGVGNSKSLYRKFGGKNEE